MYKDLPYLDKYINNYSRNNITRARPAVTCLQTLISFTCFFLINNELRQRNNFI